MQIVLVGFCVFAALMLTGIAGARIAGVTFDGAGYAALFLVCVVAGASAATAKAAMDEGRDR